jgi:hypothetical protein
MTPLRFGIKSRGTDPTYFQKNQQRKAGPVLRASNAPFVYGNQVICTAVQVPLQYRICYKQGDSNLAIPIGYICKEAVPLLY